MKNFQKRKLSALLIGILFSGLISVSSAMAADISLQNMSLLNDSLVVLIPQNLKLLTADEAKITYRYEGRPGVIFSSADNSVNLTFDYTKNKVTEDSIAGQNSNFAANYKNIYPGAEKLGEEVIDVNGKKIGYTEYIVPLNNEFKKYILTFFAVVKGRLLICNFMCYSTDMATWQPIAKQIMNSLTFK